MQQQPLEGGCFPGPEGGYAPGTLRLYTKQTLCHWRNTGCEAEIQIPEVGFAGQNDQGV